MTVAVAHGNEAMLLQDVVNSRWKWMASGEAIVDVGVVASNRAAPVAQALLR
jgi:hypothetical protein